MRLILPNKPEPLAAARAAEQVLAWPARERRRRRGVAARAGRIPPLRRMAVSAAARRALPAGRAGALRRARRPKQPVFTIAVFGDSRWRSGSWPMLLAPRPETNGIELRAP